MEVNDEEYENIDSSGDEEIKILHSDDEDVFKSDDVTKTVFPYI